jgi:ABC-type uncharacterized transport system ATPase subunit
VTASTHAIRTEGLTKRYGDTRALDALELTVSRGEVYGYLGPNGAGKTTTIRLLLGLHRPSSGRAQLFGIDAWRDPVNAHRRVAYVAGEPFLWPSLTSEETLELLAQGTLTELRHLSAQTVEVRFEGPLPDLAPLPGVKAIPAGAGALRFEVSGEIGPLIAALAEHPVATLTSREPSLEEIFLHHYEHSDGRDGG